MKGERLNILIFGANILFLVFALSVLIWLKNLFEADSRKTVDKVATLFPRTILGGPDDRDVRFAAVEDRAVNRASTQFIADLIVAKRVTGEGPSEVILYPFTHPYGRSPGADKRYERVPLADAEGEYGALYLKLDMSPVQSVRVAIWTLAGLLAFTLAVLTTRLWRQEQALTKTTIALEEKRRELIRLERLALAGLLTANILHDIKKPVLNIRHELEGLRESLGNFAGASKGLRHIEDQTKLFFDILRDLNLERFVRSQDEESEYLELPKIVEQACRLVQYEKEAAKLEVRAESGLPLVLAPQYRLIQVFSNLVLNAYQAMRGEPKGELHVILRRAEQSVEVEIADNGPGVAPGDLSRIFQPFFTTKADADGSGLGLYISQQIVEELGGEIRVTSLQGSGTTFTVALPAAAPARGN